MIKTWHFVEVKNDGLSTWTWRTIGLTGGVKSVSLPQPDYGAAVTDAILHGFRPSEHKWLVLTPNGITQFEPGQQVVIHPQRRVHQLGSAPLPGIERRINRPD